MADTNNPNPNYPPNVKVLVDKAREIYDSLKPTLEPANNGKYVVIEVTSGRHFIGDTKDEAMAEARKVFPDILLFIRRIGELEKISHHSSSFFPRTYASFL
ncbi:hypothetical protein M1271_02310 [Patescibacteria group bacterium]|nr:hypothetical protein [Patescibacteria group bacterium]